MTPIIDRQTLQQMLTSVQPPLLLEALPAKYFNDGHLPGAIHFPHDGARELAPAVVSDKQREIVVYCASATCQNSHIAANVLVSMGYGAVSVYAAGKQDWVAAGLPLEAGASQLAA